MAKGSAEAEIWRTQPPPRRKRNLACGDILAGVTAVRPPPDPGPDEDASGREGAILLHHYGIGTFRHRRTRKNADRFAAPHGPIERVARGRPPGDRHEGVAIGGQIGVSDRIAIDRAVVVRRQVHRGDDVVREDAPGGRLQRHHLSLDDRRDARLDLGERARDGQQVTAEGEAVVAQLGHR